MSPRTTEIQGLSPHADHLARRIAVAVGALTLCLGLAAPISAQTAFIESGALPTAGVARAPGLPSPGQALSTLPNLAVSPDEVVDPLAADRVRAFMDVAEDKAILCAFTFIHDQVAFTPIFGFQC